MVTQFSQNNNFNNSNLNAGKPVFLKSVLKDSGNLMSSNDSTVHGGSSKNRDGARNGKKVSTFMDECNELERRLQKARVLRYQTKEMVEWQRRE